MPQVTDIKPQKKAGRYNIYLDGQFALGLDELTLVQKGVHLGQEIDKTELTQLKDEGEWGKLYDKVLGFLAVRPRSEREVGDYLRKKISTIKSLPRRQAGQISKITETTEGVVEAVVERLKKSDLVDDEKFAQWWLEQRQGAQKPKGQLVIRNELRQKGVAAEVVERVLNRSVAVDEVALAQRAAAKKMRIYRKYPPHEFKQKMAQHLLRQGFAWPAVREVLRDPAPWTGFG